VLERSLKRGRGIALSASLALARRVDVPDADQACQCTLAQACHTATAASGTPRTVPTKLARNGLSRVREYWRFCPGERRMGSCQGSAVPSLPIDHRGAKTAQRPERERPASSSPCWPTLVCPTHLGCTGGERPGSGDPTAVKEARQPLIQRRRARMTPDRPHAHLGQDRCSSRSADRRPAHVFVFESFAPARVRIGVQNRRRYGAFCRHGTSTSEQDVNFIACSR